MKHKNLFRLFFISLLLSTFWSSCLDDPLDCVQPGMDTPAGKLAAMREYFESTSPALRQVSLGSSARSRVNSSPWSSYDISPNWDKARVWESYKKTYVEVPLKGDGVFRSSIIGSGRRNKSYPARSFLILTLDNVTEDIHYHVATTVLETRGRTKPKEEDFQYVGNADFNGFLIFSSVSGSFLKGFHIHGGKSHLIYIGSPRSATRSSEPSSRSYHLMLTPSVVRYSYDESGGGGSVTNLKKCWDCNRMYDSDIYSKCPFCDDDSGSDSGGGDSGGGETGGPIYCPFCNQPYDITLDSCPNGCEVEITPPEGDLVYCEICGTVYDTGRYQSCPSGCEVFYCDVCGKFPCICFEYACERCGSITCPGPWFCSERECTGEKCDICGGYKASTRSGSYCPVCTCGSGTSSSPVINITISVNTISVPEYYTMDVNVTNTNKKVTSVEYCMKRSNDFSSSAWKSLYTETCSGDKYSFSYIRQAWTPGYWNIKAIVLFADGTSQESSIVNVEEMFPSIDSFFSSQVLRSYLSGTLWSAAVNFATSNSNEHKVKEYGCFIYLKRDGTYYAGATLEGPEVVLDREGVKGSVLFNWGEILYDPRADDMDLIVGTMHTHYPIRWAAEGYTRQVGPSPEDNSADLPGILYDYEKDLRANHSLDLSKKFYKYGRERRETSPSNN